MQLYTYPSGSGAAGTAFTINYSFTAGASYTIAVTAVGQTSLFLKTAVVPNLNQFSTNGTGTCTPDPNVTLYSLVGTGNMSNPTSTSSTTYTTPSFSGSGQSILVVWATGGRTNLSQDILSISKIEITKTANAPSFTLPATTNVPCGSTTPVTFTVTNVNNTPNVTDYTWNLGPTPNGWLYNGSAAPQTVSTGTTNNIALTPVCGSTPHSVSATVTAGGNAYNTNSSSINLTPPSLSILSISGDNFFCTNGTYTIPGLPCNATVNWSVSPSAIAYVTGATGNQVTVNKSYAGIFSLSATITSCGTTATISKHGITAGVPLEGNLYAASGQNLTLNSAAEGANFIWEDSWVYWGLQGTIASQYSISGGNPFTPWTASDYFPNVTFYMSPTTYLTFDVATSNGSCQETLHYTFVAIPNPNSYGYYSVAPNPVSSDLTIYVDDEKLKNQKIEKSADQVIQQVVVMDKFGKALRQQSYPSGTKRITLNVSGLAADMYVAKVYNGKQWTQIKFFKK